MSRSGESVRELVRITDIESWHLVYSDARAVLIRRRDGQSSIAVGDQRGALRGVLERVAAERRVVA